MQTISGTHTQAASRRGHPNLVGMPFVWGGILIALVGLLMPWVTNHELFGTSNVAGISLGMGGYIAFFLLAAAAMSWTEMAQPNRTSRVVLWLAFAVAGMLIYGKTKELTDPLFAPDSAVGPGTFGPGIYLSGFGVFVATAGLACRTLAFWKTKP